MTRATPLRLFVAVAAYISGAEVLVMLAIPLLPPLSAPAEAALDALLLSLLVSPLLYLFMFRPMLRDAVALREARHDLERRVAERTDDLARANERLASSVEELERSNREVRLLAEMVDLFQACRSSEEAYAVIGRCAGRLLPGASGSLYVFKASRNLVEAASSWGEPTQEDAPFEPADCWALRRGRPHAAEAFGSDLCCAHNGAVGSLPSLCLPLSAQGETLGVLVMRGLPVVAEDAGDPSPRVLSVATAMAEHVALALANLQLRETLKSQAIRDPLTGLFNRRYLEETGDRELRRAKRRGARVAFIMLDVDHFKRFNDSHGHAAGDFLLQELGALLRRNLRGEDIPCRYGGEEFAVVLPDAPLEVARQRAEDLRGAVKQLQLQYRGEPLGGVSISLGVALYPDHGETPEELMRAADQALYRAKHAGRDQVQVAPAVDGPPLGVNEPSVAAS